MQPLIHHSTAAGGSLPRRLTLLPPRAAEAAGADRHSRTRFWRPLPRAAIDLVCGEVGARELPLHATETVRLTIPFSRLAVVQGLGRVAPLRRGVVHVTAA